MLKAAYFDVATGKPLYEKVRGGGIEQRWKKISNSPIEYWLDKHQLPKDGFTVADATLSPFGKEIDLTLQRERLEAEGKYLVWTHESKGFFASQQMARLITEGDPERGIEPIFDKGKDGPHNFVAYGGLVSANGVSSTVVGSGKKTARVLVIDKTKGFEELALSDRQGRQLNKETLKRIDATVGGGVMLVSRGVMSSLVRPKEHNRIATLSMVELGFEERSTLADEELGDVLEAIDKRTQAFVDRMVVQFRAKTKYPGIVKGTMRGSQWAEDLGVIAIISTEDIKGAGQEGTFLTPGIHETDMHFTRMPQLAAYKTQKVGPQVKNHIPQSVDALNSRIKAEAESLAAVVNDPVQLRKHYISTVDSTRQKEAPDGLNQEAWLYEILTADIHGVLEGNNTVNQQLNHHVNNQWSELADYGLAISSAVAQPHGELEPWEMAHKGLPEGIYAFYRSPLTNTEGIGFAFNNPSAIAQADPEAYNKHGVIFINPDLAEAHNIDFDGDKVPAFAGYEPVQAGFANKLKESLAHLQDEPPRVRYEAARSLFSTMIKSHQDAEIRPIKNGYPNVVSELLDAKRPPKVLKQPKIKHDWSRDESRPAATYRAWLKAANAQITIGRMAKRGIDLQRVALQTQYVPEHGQESMVRRISTHYQAVLKNAREGKVKLPSNDELSVNGLPAYDLQQRVEQLAAAEHKLEQLPPEKIPDFLQSKLAETYDLLMDVANGPNALLQQAAVDLSKSNQPINKDLDWLTRALHYEDENSYDPISQGRKIVESIRKDVQLRTAPGSRFSNLFPADTFSVEEQQRIEAIAHQYGELKQRLSDSGNPTPGVPDWVNRQPTLLVESDGLKIEVQELLTHDPQQRLPIWRAENDNYSGELILRTNGKENTVNAALKSDGRLYDLGPVSQFSVRENDLERLTSDNQVFVINNPSLTIRPPLALQPGNSQTGAKQYLEDAIASLSVEDKSRYAAGAWHSKETGLVFKTMPDQVVKRLREPIPAIALNKKLDVEPGQYTIRFGKKSTELGRSTFSRTGFYLLSGDQSETFVQTPSDALQPRPGTISNALIVRESGRDSLKILELKTSSGWVSNQKRSFKEEDSRLAPGAERPRKRPSKKKDAPVVPTGKPFHMTRKLLRAKGDFPVSTTIDGMAFGRTHATRLSEPYQMYGFKEGDVAIASDGKGKRVAFRVGEQHRITPEQINDPVYRQQWAEKEKHHPDILKKFHDKEEVWGLDMQPLGLYEKGRIVPFPKYEPTANDLREWRQALENQNQKEKAFDVTTMGLTLSGAWQLSGRTGRMERDFHDPSVTLTTQQALAMKRAIYLQKKVALQAQQHQR